MIAYCISLFWGIFIGIVAAVPIGPVGLICIQRTLAKNKISGLVSGFGSATADALLASVAAFSIRFIFTFINNNHILLRTTGALFLIFLGTSSIFSKKKDGEIKVDTKLGRVEEYISGFIMTITNPLTAFVFLAAFAGVNNIIGHNNDVSIIFVIGVFIGSCLWWLILTTITDRIAHKINNGHIETINKWFSKLIIAVGIFLLLSVLFKYIDII